jgi:peptidoglycan/LPS O-acetylase OafA/YrhL
MLAGRLYGTIAPVSSTHEPIAISHLRFGQLLIGQPSVTRIAVIVFFVLSGFLVGGSVLRTMRRGIFSWKKYLFQRLTRLWIVLLPALLLGAALDACGLYLLHSQLNIYRAGPYVAPVIGGRFTFSAFLGSAFFLQDIVTPVFGTNGPLWSLSYEFWFYIFFPLLVIVLSASKRNRVRVLSGLLLLVLVVLSGWKIGAYFLIWLLGAVIALLPLRLPSWLRGISTGAAGLLLLLTIYLELRSPINAFVSELILGVMFSIFLWTVLHAQEVSVHPLYRNSAQTLSAMSYTLYLVHYPMLVFISALLMPVWRLWPASPQSVLKLLPILVIVFVAAWMVYYCFERNTERIRKWLTRPGEGRA